MRTNTPRQQAVRRMTPAQRDAMMQAEIEAGYAETEAYLAEYRRHRSVIAELRANGATEAVILATQEQWYK